MEESISKEEIFEYLTMLRDSGIVNMLNASSYLQDEFSLNRREAKEYLREWIKSF